MNTRSIAFLAGATAAVAAVAAITLHHGESSVQQVHGVGKLFPGLASSLNDVATIELKRKDGATTLTRNGDSWGLAEKKGYPVDMAAVRKTLIGMSEIDGTEPKTDDPKSYSKLGLADPGSEGSTSTLVTLKDARGKELAALIVGKEHTSKNFTGPHQIFVRKPGEARCWLATGDPALKEKSADWLDKKILEVKRERIRAAEIRNADGEVTLVDRDKPDAKDFVLHDIPEGKELTYPSAPSSIADALGYLNLEDVVPASELDMKEGTSGTAKFSCFDGLTITVTTKDVGDKTYARFEASYEKPPEGAAGPPAPTEAEPKKEGGDAEPPKEDGGEKKAEAERPKPKTPEEIQKEAADLNSRLSNWVYQIPSYNKSSLEKKKSELLKDKTPPPAVPPAAPDGGAATEPPKAAPSGGDASPANPPPGEKPPEKPTDSTKPPRRLER